MNLQPVTAMIPELKNSSKMYMMFYYDDMLISLYADSELFAETFYATRDCKNLNNIDSYRVVS